MFEMVLNGGLFTTLAVALDANEATAYATGTLTRLSDDAMQFVTSKGIRLAANLAVAAMIYYIGKIVAHILSRIAERAMLRARVDELLVKFLTNILYTAMLIAVVMAALKQLGIDVTSMTAILAAAGFAIGMALQGSLGNFASGVMLIVFRPFKKGDFVEAGGTKGIVEQIEIFNTVLRTPDNIKVIVPNGAITSGVISNYAANPKRRIDLVIGCCYSDDILAVKQLLNDIIDDEPRVLTDPEPVVAVGELAESSINFLVRPWVKTEDFGAVKYDLTERIKLGFDQNGFNFPFPSRDVYVHKSTPESISLKKAA